MRSRARARRLLLTLSAGGLAAAGAAAGPAEPPPEGFAGATWVDSQGCAFQRVEVGEAVVWADRLSAQGAPVCGLTPSRSDLSPSDALPEIPPKRRGGAPVFPAPGVYAQIGAFTGKARADALVTALQASGVAVLRQDFSRNGALLRVIYAGPLGTGAEAAERLKQNSCHGLS